MRAFLQGVDSSWAVEQMTRRMMEAAEERRYEMAARYREQLAAIESLLSTVSSTGSSVLDVNGVFVQLDDRRESAECYLVRNGRLEDSVTGGLEARDLLISTIAESTDRVFRGDSVRPLRYGMAETEEVRILSAWFRRHREASRFVRHEDGMPAGGLAERVMEAVDLLTDRAEGHRGGQPDEPGPDVTD
jgi:hypothetical protein